MCMAHHHALFFGVQRCAESPSSPARIPSPPSQDIDEQHKEITRALTPKRHMGISFGRPELDPEHAPPKGDEPEL